MYRLFFAVLLCAMPLAGQGASPPVAGVNSYARTNLLAEWNDLRVLPYVDPKTHETFLGAAALYCLDALDLYTRSGEWDPANNAALGLGLLTSGRPEAEGVYKAVSAETMPSLLAPEEIGISKDDEEINKAFFKEAQEGIERTYQDYLKKGTLDILRGNVVAPFANNDLRRALWGLLDTQRAALEQYTRAEVESAQKTLPEQTDMATGREAEAKQEAVSRPRAGGAGSGAREAAQAHADAVAAERDAAKQAPKGPAGVANDKSDKAEEPKETAQKACHLMEVYRICYALDPKKLFGIVERLVPAK